MFLSLKVGERGYDIPRNIIKCYEAFSLVNILDKFESNSVSAPSSHPNQRTNSAKPLVALGSHRNGPRRVRSVSVFTSAIEGFPSPMTNMAAPPTTTASFDITFALPIFVIMVLFPIALSLFELLITPCLACAVGPYAVRIRKDVLRFTFGFVECAWSRSWNF
jgi:hypothetical protein